MVLDRAPMSTRRCAVGHSTKPTADSFGFSTAGDVKYGVVAPHMPNNAAA